MPRTAPWTAPMELDVPEPWGEGGHQCGRGEEDAKRRDECPQQAEPAVPDEGGRGDDRPGGDLGQGDPVHELSGCQPSARSHHEVLHERDSRIAPPEGE